MTGPADIEREIGLAEPLRQTDIDAFIRDGVPPLALARSWSGDYAVVSRDSVITDGDHFEFARYQGARSAEAMSAFVVVALDHFGEPIDIVAFRAGRHATWLGRANLLGGEQPFWPRVGDDALDVHESVVDWLKAERRGVVILNHVRAANDLRAAAPLRAFSTRQARLLRDALTTPPPRIVVREPGRLAPQVYGVAAE